MRNQTSARETQAPASMRAARIVGARSVRVVEAPVPEPGPDQVLIRMEGCGLCGSSLPLWQGRPWFQYPLEPGAPGHEGWGRVVALGAGVDPAGSVRLGDRVVALSYHALAEYDVARCDALVPLPPSLDGMDVPGEPLGCAVNAFRRSDIRRGHTVAVVGMGFFGALLAQLVVRAGARVLAISRRPFAVALGRALGAEAVFSLEDESAEHILGRVSEITRGRGCDRVIEAAGLQRTLDLAGALAAVRGRLIIAGYHQDGSRSVDMQAWNWRGLDVINAHERETRVYVEGMRGAVDALASGTLDLAPLLTHRRALERVEEAFELLETRPEGFLKVEVMM